MSFNYASFSGVNIEEKIVKIHTALRDLNIISVDALFVFGSGRPVYELKFLKVSRIHSSLK